MAGGTQGVGGSQAGQLQQLLQQYQGQSMNPSNYASPNQNFMQYPQQGQSNQPQVGASFTPSQAQTPQMPQLNQTNPSAGPDGGVTNPGTDFGFGDAHPAPMQTPLTSGSQPLQTPMQQGNKPLGLSQFQQPQGLQIQGNPTAQTVQRSQQK